MAENQIQTTVLTPAQQNITNFKKMVDGNYVQAQLKQVLKENAGTFATSLMEVYTNDKQLQACEPKLVIQEAIKAASLKLPLNKQLGYGYILVFNNWDKNLRKAVPTPTFVPGYRAYIQLAMRTGQYKNINADVVYEGEISGYNKLAGTIEFNGKKKSDKIIGYFAYIEMLNGFSKTLYMSVDEMANYALRYSPSFKGRNKPTVDALVKSAQTDAPSNKVGWEGNFNDMAIKTVIRRLISKYGYMSIEMQNAVIGDVKTESAEAIRNDELAEMDAETVEIDIDAVEVAGTPVIPANAENTADAQADTTDDPY
jgi:recombination protein RecT